MQDFIGSMLGFIVMDTKYMSYVVAIIILVVGIVLSWIAYAIIKRVVLNVLKQFFKKTKTRYDDLLIKHKTLDRVLYIIPITILYFVTPFIQNDAIENWTARVLGALFVIVIVSTISSVFAIMLDLYNDLKVAKERPIKGYFQILNIIIYILGAVLIVSIVSNSSPWGIVTALGALTAVLVFVFKDTILGLVASFQIVSSDILHIGDWIEVPKYGADGNVRDISLHAVRIENFDKTITSIPTYTLISDSFKNWRGMEEADGRRIKRAVNIDISSIRFCTSSDLDAFSKIHLIKDFIASKIKEVAIYNKEEGVDASEIGARRLSNVGIFRNYLKAYLDHNPKINKDMTFIIRQLNPSEHGLPIEIYIFSSDKEWANYEDIQSDIFDHILSVIPLFGLRVFQKVTGFDMKSLLKER